jgi:hypothetical protein
MAKLLGGTQIYGNATVNSTLVISGNADLSGGNVTIGTGNTAVSGIVISNVGNLYTSSPTVTVTTPTTLYSAPATANANIGVYSVSIWGGGTSYTVGTVLTAVGNTATGNVVANATFTVTSVYSGAISGLAILTPGVYFGANANPITFTSSTGSGANANVYYGVNTPTITYNGVGYTEIPTVTISGGGGSGATAYAVFAGTNAGNTRVATLGNLLSFYSPAGEAMRMGIAGNLQLFSNASSNVSNANQALLVPGGAGVGGNLYVGNRVGYTYANSASAVYSFYNAATNSYDITFGG